MWDVGRRKWMAYNNGNDPAPDISWCGESGIQDSMARDDDKEEEDDRAETSGYSSCTGSSELTPLPFVVEPRRNRRNLPFLSRSLIGMRQAYTVSSSSTSTTTTPLAAGISSFGSPRNDKQDGDIVGDDDDEYNNNNILRPWEEANRIQQEILFSLLIPQANNSGNPPIELSESRLDRKCPLCYHPKISDDELLHHCRRFHGDHYLFDSKTLEDGTVHIVGKPLRWRSLELDNIKYFSFLRVIRWCSSSSSLQKEQRRRQGAKKRHNNNQNKFKRNFTSNQTLLTPHTTIGGNSKPAATVSNKKNSSGGGNKGKKRPRTAVSSEFVAMRQYYHSRSRQPMADNAWEVDSDDLSRDEGMDDFAEACLNEFVDVSDPEKVFLNLWNRYARSSTTIADEDIAGRCLIFIRTRIAQLQGLRRELLMHLMTLWETQLINSSHLSECMREYDLLNEPIHPIYNQTTTTTTTTNNNTTKTKNKHKSEEPREPVPQKKQDGKLKTDKNLDKASHENESSNHSNSSRCLNERRENNNSNNGNSHADTKKRDSSSRTSDSGTSIQSKNNCHEHSDHDNNKANTSDTNSQTSAITNDSEKLCSSM